MEPKQGEESFQQWHEAVRRMARLGDGLPSFVRRRVWSNLADHQFKEQYVDWPHALQTAFTDKLDSEDDSLGLQITKDLHRTGYEQFGSEEDRAALQRVLFAYARWNKRVGYCQGFNVIAATILEVTERDEREAFKIMVYLIDFVLPEFYFVHNLQALSVDIAVFRHLLQARLPKLSAHLDRLQEKAASEAQEKLGFVQSYSFDCATGRFHGAYEPPLINVYAIQWFLTLFNSCLSSDAVLRIWDSLFLEGSEIILRTALVIMDFLASRLLKLKSADQFYCTMSGLLNDLATGQIVSTRELMLEIYEMAPFPLPNLKELREKFMYNITPLVSASVENVKLDLKRNPKDRRRSFRLFGLLRSKSGRSTEDRSDFNDSKHPSAVKTDPHNRSDTPPMTLNHTSAKDDFQEIALQLMPPDEREGSNHTQNPISSPTAVNGATSGKRNSRFLPTLWKNRSKSVSTSDADLDAAKIVKSTNIRETKNRNSTKWQRRQSETATSRDISKIGPGAVAPTPMGTRSDNKLPSAYEARMSTNWKQLKTQYKKQLAGQSKATLNLPGLWDAQDGDNSRVFHHSPIMAVLPQTKESKEMQFINSVDPCVPESIMQEDAASYYRKSIPSSDNAVLLESTTPMQLPGQKAPSGDVDIFDAVQSWRDNAVWSAAPVMEEGQDCKTGSEKGVCSTVSMANSAGLWEREPPFDTLSEVSCTYHSVQSGSCPQSPIRRCSSQTTFDSLCSDRTAALNKHLVNNKLSFERVDDDKVSFFTSISSNRNKLGLPPEDNTSTEPAKLAIQLPISPTRRQFGTRLGLYRAQQQSKQAGSVKRTSYNFCDRIQFITMTRTALAKQISNQA